MKQEDPFALELTADLIIRAYKAGIFPMAEDAADDDLFWVSPDERGVIPLDGLSISRSLRKAVKQTTFTATVDTDFEATIEGCATSGTDRESTWINGTIRRLYRELFERGYCHTIEIWDQGELVGGLYGLSLGSAFFGESMFHRKTNASKFALIHLVARLRAGGYTLLDTQFLTDHLASMGGIEIPRANYEGMLSNALARKGDFNQLGGGATLLDCLQSISQTS